MWTLLYSLLLLFCSNVLALAKPGHFDLGLLAENNGTDLIFGGLVEAKEASTEEVTGRGTTGDCVQYCSLSYPQHTYPQPSHLQACKGGCRSAQLDALIAWPGKPDGKTCVKGCQEVYSDDKQQYACLTGCKAPTWDTAFPDRGHLYKDPTTPEGGDMGSIMAQMWVALMAQSDVFTPREFDELQDHAMDMELVIIPYRQFDITILADDEVYSVHQYSMDHKDPAYLGNDAMSSDNSWLTYRESRHGCIWFRHRLMVTRLLMFLSVVLAVLGVCMCCSSFGSSKSGKTQEVKISHPVQNAPVLSKKAPYDFGTEFLIPFHSGTHKSEKTSVV